MGTLQRPTIDPQLRLITRRTLRRAYVPSPAFVKGYQMPARHWQCGRLRGQASDKPRGRKPRGEFAPTLVSIYGDLPPMIDLISWFRTETTVE